MIAKITSYEDKQLCGILDSAYFKEPLIFKSLVDMIEMMETAFDALGFPDKALLPRTFGKAKQRMRRHEIDLEKMLAARAAGSAASDAGDSDVLATFEIFVGFRNNAEWQGRIHHTDKGTTSEFAGIVDMVNIIDAALQ